MTAFDPTRPPAGRLVRLGVVIDTRQPGHPAVARMAERAGIDIIWVVDRPSADAPSLADDPWAAGRGLALRLEQARLGIVVRAATEPYATAAQATDLVASMPDLELGLVEGGDSLVETAAIIRSAFDAAGGPRPRLSATVEAPSDVAGLLGSVDDIVLPAWRFPDLETAADEARAEALEAGRDPRSLGVAALVPVSIGRTRTEASVRADADPLFEALGHPKDIGIFGTLEECQDRVIALAHAGITDLRCILPGSPDVHDVIAQLTAIAIGTTEVLVPGSLRSPAPPPPDGWGGRPEVPPQPGVSGGSRRR